MDVQQSSPDSTASLLQFDHACKSCGLAPNLPTGVFFLHLGEDGHCGHDLIVPGVCCGCPEHGHFDITPSHDHRNCNPGQSKVDLRTNWPQIMDLFVLVPIQADCRRLRGINPLENSKSLPIPVISLHCCGGGGLQEGARHHVHEQRRRAAPAPRHASRSSEGPAAGATMTRGCCSPCPAAGHSSTRGAGLRQLQVVCICCFQLRICCCLLQACCVAFFNRVTSNKQIAINQITCEPTPGLVPVAATSQPVTPFSRGTQKPSFPFPAPISSNARERNRWGCVRAARTSFAFVVEGNFRFVNFFFGMTHI